MTRDDINHLNYAFGQAQDAMSDETFIKTQGILNRLYRHCETERRTFAAMAMQGLVADSSNGSDYKDYAYDAVQLADALIEALNEGKD